jgi:hypothetical protein
MTVDLVTRLRSSLEPHRQAEAGCQVAVVCREQRADGLVAEGKVVLGPDWRVNPSDDLLKMLRAEFGQDQVLLSYPGQ